MATLEKDDTKYTITLKRFVDGKENVEKWFISKFSYMTVISWPEDELSESDRAKITGPASSDGNLYWLHVTPYVGYDFVENPPPSKRIWLANFEEAAEIAKIIEM